MAAVSTRLVAVDGLRGLAIALVLISHVHEALGYPYIVLGGRIVAPTDLVQGARIPREAA